METPEGAPSSGAARPSGSRPRHWWAVPLATIVLAAALTAVLMARDDAGPGLTDREGPTAEPAPVRVASDAPRYAELEELVAASDLVVRATVTATARGRVFGEPGAETGGGGGAIESRLTTVEVADVLAGDRAGGALVVEEEGWLLDGSPLIVDGLGPVAEGDEVIWFLVEAPGGEGAAHITVNAQGRFVVVGDELVGAALDDPLVARLAALAPADLEASIRAIGEAPSSGR